MKENLLKYKFLFEELVKRDFKKKYKGTVLGAGWSVLSPLLSLLIMKLIFTNFLGRDTPHYTTYLFCGNLIFSYFRESTKMGMSSLRSNASIFTKVTVPKSLFLFSRNVQTLINFGLTLPLFFLFCILDHITFTWKFFLLLYPICTMVLLNVGVGLILSALYVFFKDMDYLWNIFLTLLSYMSAIFYRADHLSPAMQKLLYLNPVYLHINYFRCITIDGVIPSLAYHGAMLGYVGVILLIGALIYKKYNHQFLYYV
ncbi:MAG: ABC transporter permease [Clostridiales bacterium]|nr:ABC transporter permease [Candidatus Cacconaster stercorequi]